MRVALRGAPVLPARAHPPGVLRAVLRALPQGDRAAGGRVHAARRVPAPVPVPRPRRRDVPVQRWQAQPDLRRSPAHPAGQHPRRVPGYSGARARGLAVRFVLDLAGGTPDN